MRPKHKSITLSEYTKLKLTNSLPLKFTLKLTKEDVDKIDNMLTLV